MDVCMYVRDGFKAELAMKPVLRPVLRPVLKPIRAPAEKVNSS